jgi:2'-5' RNA ligase
MRMFVAINLPGSTRRAIWDAAAPLREKRYPVRWVDPDAIHLTLKFLGEVADAREDEVRRGLAAAAQGAKAFSLALRGFGAFPTSQRPRVFWVGCEAAPPLELLQHRLEQEMDRIGFPLEGRPFHPHLTLGRAKRDAHPREFAGIAEQLDTLSFAADVTAQSLDLMQSTLAPGGAQYARRHAVELPG